MEPINDSQARIQDIAKTSSRKTAGGFRFYGIPLSEGKFFCLYQC